MRPPPHQRTRPSVSKTKNIRNASQPRGSRSSRWPRAALLWITFVGALLVAGAIGAWYAFKPFNTDSPPDATAVATTAVVTTTDAPGMDSNVPAADAMLVTPTIAVEPTATLTPAPPTATPTLNPTPEPPRFIVNEMQALLLDLINSDRRAAGLQPVLWDAVAAEAAQRHAQEMVDLGYLSHWNVDGYGPDFRYTQAGGLHVAQENMYSYWRRDSDGKAAPIPDWMALAADAQGSLMASEGHRANILAGEHTHVGIGVAYQPSSGEVRVVQEFVNQYVDIQPPPLRASVGDRFTVRGTLRDGVRNPVANVAYESFPEPLSIDELNARGTFRSQALFVDEIPISVAENDFVLETTIPDGSQPGWYHLRIWADVGTFVQIPVVDFVVVVN